MVARGLNKVQIIGNLGADPELRHTPSGMAVTNFRVAVNRTRKGPDGETVEETEWFRVVAWDRLGETCDEYLRRGSRVYIEGRLQSRKYTDKDGIERTSVEIVAGEMLMLDARPGEEEGRAATGLTDGGARPTARTGGRRAARAAATAEDDFDDPGELPF
jgi:single-strand DNA-binding protein